MRLFGRAIGRIVLPLISPALLMATAIALAITDACFVLFGKPRKTVNDAPRRSAASVVIPNWNGRELLRRFLPSVVEALSGHRENEIIVVDNASSDGSADYVKEHFPSVRVLSLARNFGFGGGANAGFNAARNDIVVLLNNDMRVERDFLAPLLACFGDPLVFSVSCQIFFSDQAKRREETGLTESYWEGGRLRVSHRVDASVERTFPCAYPGGGSSAFDRRKLLDLGGFDELLRPFYYEDTDLGHLAWKRGWKVLYEPRSVVHHEHRGTIGIHYSKDFIDGVLKKNLVLFCWKNIHDWGMLTEHFAACFMSSLRAILSGDAEGGYTFGGLARAFLQLGEAVASRWRARASGIVSDKEAFRRPLGGYYRDRFIAPTCPAGERLQVLFASPYPIEPPVHGGGVFMKQTLQALQAATDVHLISFLDKREQLVSQSALEQICASTEFLVRQTIPPRHPATVVPHAIREFADRDFGWAMHRIIYLRKIDVLQLEYTLLGQYAGEYEHIPCLLFEHDIFFQSLERGLRAGKFRAVALLEYLRMLRYELRLLTRMTRVQVCSRENERYLLGFLPQLKQRIDPDVRAGVDTGRYRYVRDGRERDTILFAGSFRHSPNEEALAWFAGEVLPLIADMRPQAVLVVVGSGVDESRAAGLLRGLRAQSNIRVVGYVEDIREALERYAVFVCPVLSGSGVRVKLLEAFASGIPVVSTAIGAEGLSGVSGEVCEIADSADGFANAVARLLADEAYAEQLARRAREKVEQENDSSVLGARLLASYRREVERRRPRAIRASEGVLAQRVS